MAYYSIYVPINAHCHHNITVSFVIYNWQWSQVDNTIAENYLYKLLWIL